MSVPGGTILSSWSRMSSLSATSALVALVLHETHIAYLYVEGTGPALATAPNDAQILATITRHLG